MGDSSTEDAFAECSYRGYVIPPAQKENKILSPYYHERSAMSSEYTSFGYDERYNSVVVANVTAIQVEAFAETKRLSGFFLTPQRGESETNGGLRSYERKEAGGYGRVALRRWAAVHHLHAQGRTAAGGGR